MTVVFLNASNLDRPCRMLFPVMFSALLSWIFFQAGTDVTQLINEHVLVRRGEAEVTWLNEGLSHLAEDLVAGHSESGNGSNIADFLRDPEAVSLEPGAIDDTAHRGAAYLFVRSLVDRMGPGVVLRLVATGLADRANVETATGEGFTDLMAAWGAQLYASGLGLNDHPRFNFASSLLREGEDRGFALPSERRYTFGGSPCRVVCRCVGCLLFGSVVLDDNN